MAEETLVIHVNPGTELDRIMNEAAGRPVVFERKGVRYSLHRQAIEVADETEPWANYDPERARAATRAAAGSWSDVDADTMKEYIYRGREEGSRPSNRP